jgi:hypothetical protein
MGWWVVWVREVGEVATPAPPRKNTGLQKFRNRFAPNLGALPDTPYVMIWRNTIDFCPVDFENGVVATALLCCCLWKRSEKELQIGGKIMA